MGQEGVRFLKEREYQIVFELSKEFPIKRVCRLMLVNRSGFYKWKNRINNPSSRLLSRTSNIMLFKKYHKSSRVMDIDG